MANNRISRKITNIAYPAVLVLTAVLALTGFVPLLFGNSVSGYTLIVHAALAPIFSIFLVLLIIFSAPFYNFITFNSAMPGLYDFAEKISFWIILFFSIPLILSIVFTMLPLFGTEDQIVLLLIHKYSALCLLLGLIAQVCLRYLSPAESKLESPTTG